MLHKDTGRRPFVWRYIHILITQPISEISTMLSMVLYSNICLVIKDLHYGPSLKTFMMDLHHGPPLRIFTMDLHYGPLALHIAARNVYSITVDTVSQGPPSIIYQQYLRSLGKSPHCASHSRQREIPFNEKYPRNSGASRPGGRPTWPSLMD